ncbi:MAG: DUF2807 domain-containing protein [Bacteroidia bacterium]|nr:DUF2807 domain-containing protein [Bacteroidia bacterium]
MKKLLYFNLALLLLSCNKGNRFDCFKSNGADITDTRMNGRFDSIEVRDKFEVTISTGNEYKIEVTAGKNVIDHISTEIVNGQLIISNKSKCNFVRGYKRKLKIHLTTPKLKRICNNSVGPITLDSDFKQDTLTIRAESSGDTYINGTFKTVYSSSHGNGDIYLSGTARELLIYSNGTNFTRAENFTVRDHIYISTYSLGDSYFNLEGLYLFEYYIWDEGSIYYKGNPINIHNLGDGSGKGKLVKQ